MGGREYDRSLNEKSEGGYDVMASYSPLYIIGTQYNGDYRTHLSATPTTTTTTNTKEKSSF